ncbi:hypothetical protein CcCBS67573_g07558 [Chytriomyces confervae]|uniref:Uncharacterized protein n=1 Tax=Chytriomyces confervae TaxID=246404 RepID=A0A507EVA9_9FUNG|nr:hypothetical protein HDU80_004176 [Chytriomyces hyalinus]TPX67287.1 hypothetical protein CcCBS67573_g07558 [Chytriomyces confervae]
MSKYAKLSSDDDDAAQSAVEMPQHALPVYDSIAAPTDTGSSSSSRCCPDGSDTRIDFADAPIEPPSYFNVSSIPRQRVLLRSQVHTPVSCSAEIQRTSHSVLTHDSDVASNPDAVFNYFLFYIAEKPTMKVKIRGTHEETHTEMRTVTDSNGRTRTESHETSKTVTDFNFTLDVTNYVSETWERIEAAPKREMVEPELGEWRAVIEAFTRSENPLKEIHMHKEIEWDVKQIRKWLEAAIRTTGYCHRVHIDFPKSNDTVTALADSDLSHCANSFVTKVLCFLSCLWILFWPLFMLVRNNVTGQLHAYYLCEGTEMEFVSRNMAVILHAVTHRKIGEKYVAV